MAKSRWSLNHGVGSWKLCPQWRISITWQPPSKTTIIGQYELLLQNWRSIGNCEHTLYLIHLPTTAKNLCSIGVGTTRVTKSVASQLSSEIQHSLCGCLIGNEPQNMLVYSFFNLMHCTPVQRVGLITLYHPLYIYFLDIENNRIIIIFLTYFCIEKHKLKVFNNFGWFRNLQVCDKVPTFQSYLCECFLSTVICYCPTTFFFFFFDWKW